MIKADQVEEQQYYEVWCPIFEYKPEPFITKLSDGTYWHIFRGLLDSNFKEDADE